TAVPRLQGPARDAGGDPPARQPRMSSAGCGLLAPEWLAGPGLDRTAGARPDRPPGNARDLGPIPGVRPLPPAAPGGTPRGWTIAGVAGPALQRPGAGLPVCVATL